MVQGSLEAGRRLSPLDRSEGRVGIGALLANLVRRSVAWLKARRQMRRAIDELMAFDDRTLADIGLSRGEIPYAVRRGRGQEK